MKKFHHLIFLFSLIMMGCIFQSTQSFAQTQFGTYFQNDSISALQIPIGYTRIGDQDYFGLRIQPQLRLGKLGLGLNIPLLFKVNRDSNEGSVRNEEFQNGQGSFRLLSFLRYGSMEDKLYFRLGALNQLRMGQGFLVNNYSNDVSFERRKNGLIFNYKPVEIFGIEGFYSDFNGFSNMLVLRPYIKPFTSSLSDVLGSFQIGATYLQDFDKNKYDTTGNRIDTKFVQDGVRAYSIDAGITAVKSDVIEWGFFGQFTQMDKIQALEDSVNAYLNAELQAGRTPTGAIADGYKGGSGFSIGTRARINVSQDKFALDVRLERLFYQEHFIPQFFDAIYEIDKDAKLWQLAAARKMQGTYGTLTGIFAEKVHLTGGLQIPDQVTDETPALIFFNARAEDFPIKGVTIQGNYIKGNLGNLADAFSLDERSLLTAGARYQLLGIFMIGADYRWTFARVEIDGKNTFKATTYVTPYFGLNIPLGGSRNQD